jgi:hypothetical protein
MLLANSLGTSLIIFESKVGAWNIRMWPHRLASAGDWVPIALAPSCWTTEFLKGPSAFMGSIVRSPLNPKLPESAALGSTGNLGGEGNFGSNTCESSGLTGLN